MFACFLVKNIIIYWQPFLSKGSSLYKNGKGENKMTYPELIQDLIEKLLAERDKNNELQSKLEEYKKSKD